MIKKICFAVTLVLACAFARAQSLSFADILNLTSMNDAQARDFLTVSKTFKSSGQQTVGGKSYEEYKIDKGTPEKTETILIGAEVRTASGTLSHEIIYNTTQEQDLNNLLAEAKKSTLTLIFQGADASSNIYRFDNSLFRATISIAFDKKSGNVDVQQK
ncbi:MAG: hypothetical protein JST19_14495 [Bacteroidetes bacterium]|nr:hypothetical protein [Bacteroidota bacterium]